MTEQRRRYHHGDLRRAVLDAAIEVITTDGPGAISQRDLARRAGVSHAAPAHHFGDKAGVLTALAVEGYELLAAAMTEGLSTDLPPLQALGARYVRFAQEYPAHFEVLSRADLYHRDAPEVVTARDRASRLLRAALEALPAETRGAGDDLDMAAAWSLAHGFATLWRSGNLDRLVGDRDPTEVFRAITRLAFR
jgi:AcrR family transcriptional regulator